MCVCVCVCVRERERERQTDRQREEEKRKGEIARRIPSTFVISGYRLLKARNTSNHEC